MFAAPVTAVGYAGLPRRGHSGRSPGRSVASLGNCRCPDWIDLVSRGRRPRNAPELTVGGRRWPASGRRRDLNIEPVNGSRILDLAHISTGSDRGALPG
jgi:hypothetical protein